MGIDPRLVSIWTDAELSKEIYRKNQIAQHHTEKAADALREAREIAAQLSMRHPKCQAEKDRPHD